VGSRGGLVSNKALVAGPHRLCRALLLARQSLDEGRRATRVQRAGALRAGLLIRDHSARARSLLRFSRTSRRARCRASGPRGRKDLAVVFRGYTTAVQLVVGIEERDGVGFASG
jgi:hypothetical protein